MAFLSKNIIAFVSFTAVSAALNTALAAAVAAPVPTSPVPELSDYLAMAFVAITGGYLVYRTNKRKRTSL
jgi:hypothetical protein